MAVRRQKRSKAELRGERGDTRGRGKREEEETRDAPNPVLACHVMAHRAQPVVAAQNAAGSLAEADLDLHRVEWKGRGEARGVICQAAASALSVTDYQSAKRIIVDTTD